MLFELRSCVWELTLACCFSCRHCGSAGGKARENELSTEECINIVSQLAAMGCKRVSLIGGEIFIRKDWNIIAKELYRNKIKTSVITNGFTMSEQLIAQLVDCGVESLAVSVDGTEKLHDHIRQQGSFARAIATIKSVSSHGIPVSVISTLNSLNVYQLNSLYELLKDLPIFAWQLQACSPMGNAAGLNIDYHFDFSHVIGFVAEKNEYSPFLIGVADNIGYFTDEEGYIRGNPSGFAVFPGCSAGISAIAIDSIGNVRGCESLYDDRFIEGNLRKLSLMEIWNNPDTFSYNRHFRKDMLTGKCASCIHGEYCKAGCRSYNYFVHKKLYESPECAFGKRLHEVQN